jgi:hypothetical protein
MVGAIRIRVLNWLFKRPLKSLQQVMAKDHLKARSSICGHTTPSRNGDISHYGLWYQIQPVVHYISNHVLSAWSIVETLYTLVPIHTEAHR